MCLCADRDRDYVVDSDAPEGGGGYFLSSRSSCPHARFDER